MTKSTAGKNSSGNIFELERRDLDAVWKMSRSARYSGLLVAIDLRRQGASADQSAPV